MGSGADGRGIALTLDAKRSSAWPREVGGLVRRLDRLIADVGDDPVGRDLLAIWDEIARTITKLGIRERAAAAGAGRRATGALRSVLCVARSVLV